MSSVRQVLVLATLIALAFAAGTVLGQDGGDFEVRSWSPHQATGEPDTHRDGDIPTAFAPRTGDESVVSLVLFYDRRVVPQTVRIYETYNPGAVVAVSGFLADGTPIDLWEGTDPNSESPGVAEIDVDTGGNAIDGVLIFLDTDAVSGWNEIDAVGLVDGEGDEHFAARAVASSAYSENSVER